MERDSFDCEEAGSAALSLYTYYSFAGPCWNAHQGSSVLAQTSHSQLAIDLAGLLGSIGKSSDLRYQNLKTVREQHLS